MSTIIVLTAGGVIAALVALSLLIRRYPLSSVQRYLRCPEHNFPANVRIIREESGFGNMAMDVGSCSLYPGGRPPCGKTCLR